MYLNEIASLKSRSACVTGAAGSLGAHIAKFLASLGADLVLVDMPGLRLENLAAEIHTEYGTKVKSFHCDLEYERERIKLAEDILGCTPVDILVNNAAFVGSSDLTGWAVAFEEQSISTWRRAVEVNMTAAFHLTQLLYKSLKRNKNGVVLNIGSIYGQFGPDWSLYSGTQMSNPAAYSASKGGLISQTRWLATTLAPDVRVNSLSPGGFTEDSLSNL